MWSESCLLKQKKNYSAGFCIMKNGFLTLDFHMNNDYQKLQNSDISLIKFDL